MKKIQRTKASQRFVMYISTHLRKEIEARVRQSGVTLAAFGRQAFETYLGRLKTEEIDRQLAQTCLIFQQTNQKVFKAWAEVDQANWPS